MARAESRWTALGKLEEDVAWVVEGGETLRDTGDQGACGATSPACVAAENRWNETDVVLMASAGCVVERR